MVRILDYSGQSFEPFLHIFDVRAHHKFQWTNELITCMLKEIIGASHMRQEYMELFDPSTS